MRKFIRVLTLSWILALGLLAGCSDEQAARRNDPRVTAAAVPTVAAQALTLRFGLGSEVSLQEVGNQDAASLLVEDVDGYPLVYLTVQGPEAHGSFWEAARAAVSAREGHYLVTTGASALYPTTLFADTGTDTLEHLLAAANALGGPDAVARVVGFGDPGRYYLVDREGRFFDGYTGDAVSAEEVEHLTGDFHDAIDRLAEDEDYRAEMAHVWACLLGEASEEECNTEDNSAEAANAREAEAELLSRLGYDPVSVQSTEARARATGMGLADMTGADGELDFAKAQWMIEQGGAKNFNNRQEVAPQWRKWQCADWFCFGGYWVLEARQGTTDAQRNANPVDKDHEWHTVGQNWQGWWDYGYRWKDYFNSGHNDLYSDSQSFPPKFHHDAGHMNNFVLPDLITGWDTPGEPIGCGPAAFIRLAAWFQFERHQYNGGSNINWYGNSPPSWPRNYSITDPLYMRWKNNWLGGRMLKFHKEARYSNHEHYYVYIPDLPRKMNTHAVEPSNPKQALTFPGPFMRGANAWLAERGSSLRLRGGGYVRAVRFIPLIGWLAWRSEVWKMYSAAMGSIGVRNEPGIALMPTSPNAQASGGIPLGYHYAPTLEARLYNWHVRAEVLARMPYGELSDSRIDGKFVNISSYNLLTGGFYELR